MDPHRAVLTLTCSTDPEPYDQYLTIQVALPSGWSPEEAPVKPVESGVVVPTVAASEGTAIRFNLPSITAASIIERAR